MANQLVVTNIPIDPDVADGDLVYIDIYGVAKKVVNNEITPIGIAKGDAIIVRGIVKGFGNLEVGNWYFLQSDGNIGMSQTDIVIGYALDDQTLWVDIKRLGKSVGDIGVFGGGNKGSVDDSSTYTNSMDYIRITIPSNASVFGELTTIWNQRAASDNGSKDRGVFAGGDDWNDNDKDIIEYITISTSGNASYFGDLSTARGDLHGQNCSNKENDRGVFGGGQHGSAVNLIDYITISTLGNAQDFGDLTREGFGIGSTSNGTNDRGVFGGGYGADFYNIIDYITISTPGNAQDFGDLTVTREYPSATSNGTNDRGVFGGGWNSSICFNTIDYITISTPGNAQDFGDLTVARISLSATSNGIDNSGVFGGGWDGSNAYNVLDYITISSLSNAQDFGDLTRPFAWGSACSNAN